MNLTHPADGIYYTTEMRFFASRASKEIREQFLLAASLLKGRRIHSWDRVLITWQLLSEVMKIKPCLSWLIEEMKTKGRITISEYDKADLAYYQPNWNTDAGLEKSAKVVMDLLLVRAKREGLVS